MCTLRPSSWSVSALEADPHRACSVAEKTPRNSSGMPIASAEPLSEHRVVTPPEPDSPYREINDAIARAGEGAQEGRRRRRVPRQSVSWFGRYRVDEESDWGTCEVVDVSIVGVGVFIDSALMDELIGHHLT